LAAVYPPTVEERSTRMVERSNVKELNVNERNCEIARKVLHVIVLAVGPITSR